MCEDCKEKGASYGMEGDPMMKRRWCSGCAKGTPGHPGAISMVGRPKQHAAAASPYRGVPQLAAPHSTVTALSRVAGGTLAVR